MLDWDADRLYMAAFKGATPAEGAHGQQKG